jgi:nucleoid-associated protein YgaU
MKKILFVLFFPLILFSQEKLTEKRAREIIDSLRKAESEIQAELSSCQNEVNALRQDVSSLDEKINSLNSEINSLKEALSKYPSEYTVKKGDFLAKISSYDFIYGTYKGWPRIWRANISQIKNPNLIYPGMVLKIPHGLDKKYTVIKGDYLWKIASFWWIYRDGKEWKKIYEANKDKIKNPNLIYPGEEITIPR